MDLIKIGKARDLLMKSEKSKKALIDAFSQEKVTENKTSLLLIQEIAVFCEREDAEITLIEGIISSLLRKMKPATGDVVEVLEILGECQRDLKDYIVEKMDLSGPQSKEFIEYYSILSGYVENREKEVRKRKKELVWQQIFQTPGLYITLLADILERQHGKEGFSFSSVLQYINELTQERKVITVGGPQGRERYCFVDPRMITNRSEFYHHLFATRGLVEERVTDRFTLTRKFRDIFLINHVEKQLLLVVDYGRLHHIEGSLILSYGDLEPFEYLVENEGFKPKEPRFNQDVLRARKVDRVVNGREEVLWIDEERANLFNYSSPEQAATYSNVPSANV